MIVLKNGKVLLEGKFTREDVYISEGRIISAPDQESPAEVIDCDNKYVIPGLVDIHTHGCFGYDFCDGTSEALQAISAYEMSQGVMAFLPTSMTLSKDNLISIFENARDFCREREKEWNENPDKAARLAEIAGIHAEGPFISPEKKGAQNGKYLQKPDSLSFRQMQEASGGMIRLISLAPEISGAMEFIRENAEQVKISIAHTTADYDTAMEAFRNGADHVTHSYNAMNPFTHRAPGVIGAGFDSGAYMEIICDGIHIHPSVIRATVSMIGPEKMVLISDSMMGTGLEDGLYQLGGQEVKKTGNKATLGDGTIAGSVTDLYHCMRKAVEFGIPFAQAARFATENPAKSVGLYPKYGSLEEGALANILVLDENLDIVTKIHRGIIV